MQAVFHPKFLSKKRIKTYQGLKPRLRKREQTQILAIAERMLEPASRKTTTYPSFLLLTRIIWLSCTYNTDMAAQSINTPANTMAYID